MKSDTATIIGFLTAPLISAAILSTFSPLRHDLEVLSILGFVTFFYVPSFAAMTLFAAPLFYFFHSFDLIKWWSATGSGVIVGAVVSLLVSPAPVQFETLLLLGSAGGASGFGFWLIWRQGSNAGSNAGSNGPGSN